MTRTRTTMKDKIRTGIIALAAALSLTFAATPANAAVQGASGTVASVSWQSGDSMFIQLTGGVNYQAFTVAPAACTGWQKSMDTLKVWQSLAQSALLSRKQIGIWYDTCNSIKFITELNINN